MKINPLHASALAAVVRLSDRTFLLPVAAKGEPSGAVRNAAPYPSPRAAGSTGTRRTARKPSGGSSSSSGSRPSSPSSPSSPSRPSYSSPSNSSPTANRPSSPTTPAYARPPVRTPNGKSISPTTRSPYNPSPAYKPRSPSGAPTVRSGGGGYSTAKKVLAGAALGAAVTIAAGYFMYGGRRSSPYCRGGDSDRFLSGRCPRGTSSQAHTCKTNIPLCPIPAAVRDQWALGGDALPKVDVLFDKSVCSVIALPTAAPAAAPATTAVATPAAAAPATGDANTTSAAEGDAAAPAAADATVPAVAATIPEVAVTSAPTAAPPAAANSTRRLADAAAGVEGESGLDACFRRIIAAGGCADHTPSKMFQLDEASGTCGCCASVQVSLLAGAEFTSAIFGYREDTTTAAPAHCISGSTLFYPAKGGGEDVVHACACGACTGCGGGAPRYLDWSGPFVVSDAEGSTAFTDATKTVPLYDPVDTCLCDDASPSICEGDLATQGSGAGAVAGGVFASNLVVASSALIMLVGFVRRG